jgi:hypothetical protein
MLLHWVLMVLEDLEGLVVLLEVQWVLEYQ